MKRIPTKVLVAGVFTTGVISLMPWNYCMGGTAHGMPLAIIKPSHGALFGAILLEPDAKTHGAEIWLVAAGANILFWSIITFTAVKTYQRIVRRNVAV